MPVVDEERSSRSPWNESMPTARRIRRRKPNRTRWFGVEFAPTQVSRSSMARLRSISKRRRADQSRSCTVGYYVTFSISFTGLFQAPMYTVVVSTSSISSSSEVDIRLALIGNVASTLPIHLRSNATAIQYATKHAYQSGSRDVFQISSLETVDIGQVGVREILHEGNRRVRSYFYVHLRCDTRDQLLYYCESIEVINNLTDEKYLYVESDGTMLATRSLYQCVGQSLVWTKPGAEPTSAYH